MAGRRLPAFDIDDAGRGGRRLMYVAAAFNFGAALTLPLLARHAPQVLALDPMTASQLVFVDLFAALVAAFGIGYALGGIDLARFWPLVALGVVGKGFVVVVAGGWYFAGALGTLPALLAVGDGVFAALFHSLLRSRMRERKSP